MKFVLIPCPTVDAQTEQPTPHVAVGLISLATILTQAGYKAQILDINSITQDARYLDIPQQIMTQEPDIIGISTMGIYYQTILRLASECKRIDRNVKIVLGGVHATYTAKATIRNFSQIDIVARGECEQTIIPLMEALTGQRPLDTVSGLTYRDNHDVRETPDTAIVEQLDEIPFPDYALYPRFETFSDVFVDDGRGCPYCCTFCGSNHFRQHLPRLRSPAKLLTMIRQILCRFGPKRIAFLYDTFTYDRERTRQLCRLLQTEAAGCEWSCSTRIDHLDADLLNDMAAAGCISICFGIETGSPEMQKRIGKNLPMTQVRDIVATAIDNDMHTVVSLIMGFPDETRQQLSETLELLVDLKFMSPSLVEIRPNFLYPTISSRIYNQKSGDIRFDGHLVLFPHSHILHEDIVQIMRYPEVFNMFYAYPANHIPRLTLLKIHYLILSLLKLPLTMFTLYNDPEVEFPDCIFRGLEALDIYNNDLSSGVGLVNYTAEIGTKRGFERTLTWLRVILGKPSHYIIDMMRYELGLHGVSLEKRASSMAFVDFDYDVEDLAIQILDANFHNCRLEPDPTSIRLLLIHMGGKPVWLKTGG